MRLLGGIAVAASILLAGAVVAELVLRLRASSGPTPVATDTRGLPLLDAADLVRPNARGIYRGMLYEANRFGFRGPEVEPSKPAGTVRIVVIGDSVPMGTGIRAEATYAARLAVALEERYGDRRFEALNLGWAGASFQTSLVRLRNLGLQFEPDIVIYGFSLDDLDGLYYRKSWSGRDPGTRPPQPVRLHLWSWLRPRLWSAMELVSPPAGSFLFELDDNYFHNPDAWREFQTNLDSLVWEGRRSGFCVHVLIHATLHHLHGLHPYRRHYDAVARAVSWRGVGATGTLETFLAHRGRPLRVSFADAHPNELGHELMAAVLLEDLVQLPTECGLGEAAAGLQ